MNKCRHGRPECECSINPHDHTCSMAYLGSSQPLSSGRWDAVGSWNEAVLEERKKAFNWAVNLSAEKLHWVVTIMADDLNAFSLYERKAVLEVIALKLGKEVFNEQ